MNRLQGLFVAGLGFWLMACGGGGSGITAEFEVIELGEHLRVAEFEGRVDPLPSADAESSAGLRMAVGSRMTLHFAFPDSPAFVAATLAQRLRWSFDRDASGSNASKPSAAPSKPGPEVLKRLQELGYIE
jgi:hypothetical protein